jgi:hypothetical protein
VQVVFAATYDEANLKINGSYSVLLEFQDHGFSAGFLNDTIIQSEIVLEQARYAEILRNSSSSASSKQDASRALRLVDWKNISYDSVLIYTNLIDIRKAQAYEIYDSLNVIDKKIKLLQEQNIDVKTVLDVFTQANVSFYEDRYDESISFIEKTNLEIERVNSQNATMNVLGENAKNFILRNWLYIVIVLVFVGIIGYMSYGKIRVYVIEKSITRLKKELEALNKLMIRNQEDRFRNNKISGLVYNIRMKKYGERIDLIKETLPVLENRVKRFKNKGGVNK